MIIEPKPRFKPSRPRRGQQVTFNGRLYGTVVRVEGAICYVSTEYFGEASSFIWAFPDTLNTMFDWPTKV